MHRVCPYPLWRWWSYKCLVYLSPQCCLLFFSLLKVFSKHIPSVPLVWQRTNDCFKHCCPLLCRVYLESPLWQKEPQFLQKESKKINIHITELCLAEDEQKRKQSPCSLPHLGQKWAGRQVQGGHQGNHSSRSSKVPWSLLFFLRNVALTCLQHSGSTLVLHFVLAFLCVCLWEEVLVLFSRSSLRASGKRTRQEQY